MADSIRSLYMGREAVEGVLATTSMKSVLFTDASVGLNFARIITHEHNGIRIKARVTRRGVATSDFTVTVYGYYDQLGFVGLASAFGPNTSAGVSMATGAFDHTFKSGAASLPTYSIQFQNGTDWWQMLGCSVNTWTLTATADKLPQWTFGFVCREAAKISAPTLIPESHAAYSQPWDIPQQSITIAGSGSADVVSLKISAKNGRDPLHTIGSQSMRRAFEGDVEVTFDAVLLYLAYTGSMVEKYVTNASPGAFVYTCTSTTDLIGTGTPVAVSSILTMANPLITSAEPDPKNTNTLQNVKGTLGYDSSSATNASLKLRNEIVAAGYDGS